jgi:hypothetical protein
MNTSDIHHHQRKLDHDLHRERNTLVLLGCLAEKLGLFSFWLNFSSFLLFVF